ncbi:MAG: hypothetical protein WDO15_18350 [Bacteroidota bacterium]
MASELFSCSKDLASKLVGVADVCKKSVWADSINTIEVYSSVVHLAITIFRGYIKRDDGENHNYAVIEELIRKIPSVFTQLDAWAEVAYACLLDKNTKLLDSILDWHIGPLHAGIEDDEVKNEYLNKLAALYYYKNSYKFFKDLERVSARHQQQCYRSVLDFILTNQHPYDLMADSSKEFIPSYESITNACDIISRLESDVEIYSCIKAIAKKVQDNNHNFNEVARKEIVRLLEVVINKKLPNPEYIKHDGFKIVAQAELLRLSADRVRNATQVNGLINQVPSISNTSDRGYVYALLFEIVDEIQLKSGHGIDRPKLLDNALNTLETLSCDSERLGRLKDICKIIYKARPETAKKMIQDALLRNVDTIRKFEIIEIKRSLFKAAYDLQKEFGKSLMKQVERDAHQLDEWGNEALSMIKDDLKVRDLADEIIHLKKGGESYRRWVIISYFRERVRC